MKIYNTLSRKKEIFDKDGQKNLFVCGPTVYDLAHIGHARTYLAFDIIVKYLRSQGWNINYVQNITDVDDRIIDRAKENNQSPFELAKEYEEKYMEDMKTLGIDSIDTYARASDHIAEIIDQVEQLIDKGFAYEAENGIYFEVRKFEDYGKLSGQNIDELESGSRVDVDENKKDPLDFALWKKRNKKGNDIDKSDKSEHVIVDGEPLWQSPWGWGRPGWHIEDTAISEALLGEQYDIHGGAEDLKFPHHESEIAQQEAASGKKPFVKLWMHSGLLNVDGEKMSKSLGNFITIRDFLEDYSPRLMRWMVLTHHYRSKMNYTKDTAEQAHESLEKLEEFIAKMEFIKEKGEEGKSDGMDDKLEGLDKKITKAMADDFNTPQAISEVFKFIHDTQENIWKLGQEDAKQIKNYLTETFSSLGMKFTEESVPEKAKKMAKKREELRGNEQFMQADELRDKVRVLGYEIEDTPLGPFIKKPQKNNG